MFCLTNGRCLFPLRLREAFSSNHLAISLFEEHVSLAAPFATFAHDFDHCLPLRLGATAISVLPSASSNQAEKAHVCNLTKQIQDKINLYYI